MIKVLTDIELNPLTFALQENKTKVTMGLEYLVNRNTNTQTDLHNALYTLNS